MLKIFGVLAMKKTEEVPKIKPALQKQHQGTKNRNNSVDYCWLVFEIRMLMRE